MRIAGKAADFVKPVMKNAGDFVAKNLDNVLRNAGEAIGKGLSGIGGGGLMALGTKGAKEGLEAVAEKAGKEIGEEVAEAVGKNADDIIWPPNGGAIPGTEKNVVLSKGYQFDRYGYDSGTYVSPAGTPYEMRSLAPGTDAKPYKAFEVVKPVRGTGSITAPWFNQPGGGIQFELEQSVEKLLELNWIKEITP